MTKFSFEVPIAHLHDFEEDQDFLFTLSFLYNRPEYVRYVRDTLKVGVKCVWLDNSYNELEKADNFAKMIELYINHRQHRVISPDDPKWTKEQIAFEYMQMNRTVKSHELIAVVNSPEMMEYLKTKGARNFAYSYHCRGGKSYEDMLWARECHFLGLISPYEVAYIKPPTCDTSMPIKLALQHKKYSEWMQEGCTHQHTKDLPSFFDVVMTDRELKEAKDNIKRMKEFANG